jgi:DNA processing protein
MGDVTSIKVGDSQYPAYLAAIAGRPKQLYYVGDLFPLLELPRLAVVGSRRTSPYGQAITKLLTQSAAERGIVIVSGLALGVDGLAHQAALDAGGKTIAVLPCGLDYICPRTHVRLAKQILRQGGALVTEYPAGTAPLRPNFVARNRIVSGLSDAVLITEAAEKSGSIHTANFALEQGRAVMAVPGNITSLLSVGTNNLIKAGAAPVTCPADILSTLGIEHNAPQREEVQAANAEEAALIELLLDGITDASELLARSNLTTVLFNQTLTMLEITGKVRPLGANHWTLV